MNPYRTLLWWLALAVVGALAWTWFAQDPGDVVIRFRGWTVTTTLAYFVVAWGLAWFALWALSWLLRLPLRAWRRRARQLARNRLVSGFEAFHQGRWARAESLAAKAVEDDDLRTPALLLARRAAAARGDVEAVARHHAALLAHDPATAALEVAANHADAGRHEETLAALATIPAPLPPRALLLQARAQAATGRAGDALAALNPLRNDQALAPEALAALEAELVAASLAQAPDADVLRQRWYAAAARLQHHAGVAGAFARRAAALGLEDEGAAAAAEALDAEWNDALVATWGALPAGRAGSRLPRAEAWLAARPSDPVLLLVLGRLCAAQQLWGKAEDYLHRAIAQGAGADAWEALGHVFAAQDDARATIAFANALRLSRGEPLLALAGRSVRDQIADRAVAEQRNEHGLPLIPR